MTTRPRIAITMGDAAGIGPEITVKSLADARATEWCVPLVIGDARVLERAMEATGTRLGIRRISAAADAAGTCGTIDVLDDPAIDMAGHRWGEVDARYGDAAVRWTKEAGRLALAGEIDAMVSAPLNKEAMHAAGHAYEGQTGILGEMTRSKPSSIACGSCSSRTWRSGRVQPAPTARRLLLADAACATWASRPGSRGGLNPHAGENGAFGREESAAIMPRSRLRAPVGCPGARSRRYRVPQVTRRRLRHDARPVPTRA